MTNELEKHFFSIFGIEPIYKDACTVEDKYWNNEELANEYGTFDQYMNCKCGNQENCTTECSCAYQKEVYPQITDRILLELMCIDFEENPYKCRGGVNITNVKEYILDEFRWGYKNDLYRDRQDIKHQVRTLFEEG